MARDKSESDNNDSSKSDNWRDNLEKDSFEYALRDFWEKYSNKIKIYGGGGIAGLIVLSNIYTVPQNSVGIEKLLGRYYTTTNPGPHMTIPFMQEVTKVENKTIFSEAFGFRNLKPGVKSQYIGRAEITEGKIEESDLREIIENEGLSAEGDIKESASKILREEYLKLNGDLSMADVEWVVQYRISDPVAYSFNIKSPRKTLRDLSESVMSSAAGDASIDEILTIGRKDIETYVKQELQKKLNNYNFGLEITLVQLQSSNAPERVRQSFNDVNTALQTKQQKINNAQQEYNKVIPEAEGKALAQIQQALGYKTQRINNALGDVARFQEVYSEYKNAPGVTRTRMYLEAMPNVLDNAKAIYYIENQSNNLQLNHLNLNGETK